jgi:lipoate-protein ligase A
MQKLSVWVDPEPRDAAFSMALDQALFEGAAVPVLRVYQWTEPCLSCGYFAAARDVQSQAQGLPWVRRWTGGGVVPHGADWAYTLLVPRSENLALQPPAETYRWIHARILDALGDSARAPLGDYSLSANVESKARAESACFENPVLHDLLWNGRKVGGAGQRRTRHGLMHQGSLQLPRNLHPRAETVARALAEEIDTLHPQAADIDRAETLRLQRYASQTWNLMR